MEEIRYGLLQYLRIVLSQTPLGIFDVGIYCLSSVYYDHFISSDRSFIVNDDTLCQTLSAEGEANLFFIQRGDPEREVSHPNLGASYIALLYVLLSLVQDRSSFISTRAESRLSYDLHISLLLYKLVARRPSVHHDAISGHGIQKYAGMYQRIQICSSHHLGCAYKPYTHCETKSKSTAHQLYLASGLIIELMSDSLPNGMSIAEYQAL